MPNSAYELNLEYGLIDPDELEDIGTEEERSEALIGASLPSIKPSSLDLDIAALSPPEETTPIVPTGLARQPSIPRAGARIQPIAQPARERGPIFRTAEAMLSPAEQLNREYGLTPITEGIVPREISRPESPAARLNREMGLSPLTRPIGETKDTQEPGTPVSTIFKDLMVPVEPPPPPPPEKPGLIGEALRGIPHGVLQVGEIAGGLVGLAGEVTGIEAIERVGAQLHQTFQEMNQKFAPTVAGFQDIESVGDAARYLGHGFMSMLPFMMGTFGAGAAIRGVVTKTLGKAITERAAAKAVIGFSSLAAASTAAEAGIIAGERIDEGMKALSTNLLWAAPAGLMDALPAWRLLGKLGWFGRTVAERAEKEGLPVARRYFLKEFGRQGFFEGVTESAQEIFEALGAGRKPFSYETLMQAANAFIIAGFTGGVMGGAASLLGPPSRRAVEPPPVVKPPPIEDITRAPLDLLKPAIEPLVAGPDIAALWKETVLRDIEEPILEVEMKRVWGNFLGGTKIWTELDVKNDQVIITGASGEQLSFNFDKNQPTGKEFLPDTYTDKNGVSTKLAPNAPLPKSFENNIRDGLVLEKPTKPGVRVVGVGTKKPRKVGLTSYSGRFVTAGYGFTRYSGTERITRKNYSAAYEAGELPDVWYAYGDEHEVEPMFRGMPPQRVEVEFKIFDRKLATEEELTEFEAKQDEVAARLEKKWGFNRNMPDQAQVLGYQTAKELGYDGLNTGRAIAMFHDLPAQMRPKVGAIRGAIEPTLPRGYNSVEEFTDPINTPLRTSQYSILTAANPGNIKLSAQENAVRNKKLVKELKDAGFIVIPVRGKYAGLLAPSFLIPEMSNEQALEFGIRHGQESVLVPSGLLYQDGSVNPANLDAIVFDNTLTDNYTEINIGGERIRFSTPIDFDTKIERGAGVTAAPTPPGEGLVPAATPVEIATEVADGSTVDLLGKKVVAPITEPAREVPPAPMAPPALPLGTFEAVIMFDEQGAVSVRPTSHEGAENLPGFLGKVFLDANQDTVYTPEMMIAKNAGEAVEGIARSKIEALRGEGFRPAFQELLPDDRFRARMEEVARPTVPPFYHLSEVIINSKMTGPMSSIQILKMLQNAGVKQDELMLTGLEDLLKQPKKFTKQEVLDFIRQNRAVVERVTSRERDVEQILFADYAESLDKKYGEPIYSLHPKLTAEESARYNELAMAAEVSMAARFGPETHPSLNLPGGTKYEERFLTLPNIEGFEWEDGHGAYADVKNPIVRLRFDRRVDSEGRNGVFFQEMQPPNTEEQSKMPKWVVKRWREFALKEMIRIGAEENAEWIGWTTGEQQAARYGLSKQINRIDWTTRPNGNYEILPINKENEPMGDIRFNDIPKDKLSEIIGKNISQKIISSGQEYGSLEGLDLKVGGEGLRRIYDQDFPNIGNNFGKKWGVKVGETDIELIGILGPGLYKKEAVHSLDITPSMKESVLYEGQPLFREAMEERVGLPMSLPSVQKIIDNFVVQIPKDVLGWKPVSSVSEIPTDIARRAKLTGKTQAFYDRVLNEIYVIADRHASEQDVLTSICHELFTHFGFERLFGPHRMDQIVQEVLNFYGRENLAYLYQAYNKIPGSPDGDYTVAIEKIAEFAGTGENPGLWKRFVYWFRYYATKLFGPIRFSEDDIRAYLWRSRILIQQQSFQDQVRKYNAFVKLTGANMWDNGLPIGPLGARFAMREDTSPSHESAAENFTGWRGWYEAHQNRNKNFGNEIFKRLGLIESVGSLPHWIGMNHPSFKPVTQVQWDRMDEKNRDRLYLLQDPGTNQGNNPYMSVDLLKDTSGVDPLIVWSDRENIYLADDENLQRKAMELIRRNLTSTEIKAYRGWKDGFDRAVDYAIARLRQLAVDFYSSATWYSQLRGVLDGSLSMEQVQLEGGEEKDFQRALKKVNERMGIIDEQETQLKKLNFYTPHVRGRGDHIVRVYDIDEEGKDVAIWVERFDNATQAERARMRLGSQYRDLRVVKTLEKQTGEFIYGGLNIYAMEAFLKKSAERAVKEGGINEAEADTLLSAVFKSIHDEVMARGFRQHYIRRKQGNIGGYREENLRQVFLDYMSGLSGSMAKLDATRKFHDALQSIDKVNESETYEYAARYATDMLRNRDSLDNKLNALKTIPYLWYISMNLRLAATQMFQNGITAYPILSRIMQDLGVEGHASTELARAMKDLAGTMTEQEQTMLQRAYNEGETMANFIQEIKGDISRSWAGKYFTKFVDLVSYPFAGMERFNRKSSLLAAFRVALRAGQTEAEAYETAKEFVRSAHYAYGLSNFPQLLRDGTPFSKIAGLGYVFKSFPHNYVLSMIHYTKGKDGRLVLGVLMRSLAALTILGGLGAAPFIDDILDEFERQTGYPARSVIRKSLEKVGGPLLASAGMEGILALVGLDMSGSTKIQIPIPGVGEYDPGAIMMGVYGGLIDKGKNAISFAANNQWMRAIESAMPAGVESAIKSHRLATEGLRTATGKPILDERGRPIKAGPYEVAAGLAGFRPARIAGIQKERRVAQNIKDAYTERRKKIIRKMRLATTPEERRELSKDIQSYNLSVMKYGKIIPKIGAQTIRQAMKPERGYMEYERLFED